MDIEECKALRAEVERLKNVDKPYEKLIAERDEARAERDDALDRLRICGECATTLRNKLTDSIDLTAERDAALAKLKRVREWAESAAEDYGDEWEKGYCDGGRAVLALIEEVRALQNKKPDDPRSELSRS